MVDGHLINSDTNVIPKEYRILDEEREWLREAGVISGMKRTSDRYDEIEIDFQKLSQIAFEYEILDAVASNVDIEILRFFLRSDETTHTTHEICRAIDRPKSSVSRSLGKLSRGGQLEKVQKGVYRFNR